MTPTAWLRSRFITGFFVTVPLVVSVVALVWVFGIIDGLTAPVSTRLLGRSVPGLGVAVTALVVLGVGVIATNVLGRRVLERAEDVLMRVPVFRTVYAPVKQLIVAFSPDNEYGFKRVVVVDDTRRGLVMGFLTKEFELDQGRGPEAFVAVYVPTNHLYLGDICIYPRERALFPDLSVEEGIRMFLTGGMSLPGRLTAMTGNDRGSETRPLTNEE
ncbi:MAG: DUF502 domain-containing protein [Acidimicrobiia bacterium]|nr:DUF502 domain-containing protein [Acidimicrobiia bacterium]